MWVLQPHPQILGEEAPGDDREGRGCVSISKQDFVISKKFQPLFRFYIVIPLRWVAFQFHYSFLLFFFLLLPITFFSRHQSIICKSLPQTRFWDMQAFIRHLQLIQRIAVGVSPILFGSNLRRDANCCVFVSPVYPFLVHCFEVPV